MNNPEFRQTLHNISHNLETANQAAQENIYTFTQIYVDPCLDGFKACVTDFTAPCFPTQEDRRLRRNRGRSRGRAEYNFDFYNAWDDDEALGESGLSWGNDELDSLLAGRGVTQTQPRKQRAMSYGSRGRRGPVNLQPDSNEDPTIIPGSSYLGFLERLPWGLGSRKLRYQPSAADLQVNPGGTKGRGAEGQPLIEEVDEEDGRWSKGHGRQRSGTAASRSTTNSHSSRGDLIMSDEDEYEDAQPLGDEFAVMLSRRNTNQGGPEDHSSGKTRNSSSKRPGATRGSTRTTSSTSVKSPKVKIGTRSASSKSLAVVTPDSVEEQPEPPTMAELHREEAEAALEEELEIQQKREAARRLALERGLNSEEMESTTSAEVKPADQMPTLNTTDVDVQQLSQIETPVTEFPKLNIDDGADDKT
jgi:hypothetical protein